MKRSLTLAIGLGVLTAVIVANTTQAQQGGRRSQAALILCDALVLNQAQSDKVVSVYQDVSQKLREERQNSGQDFQSMSDEERTKWFTEYREKQAAALKKGLADVLSEDECNAVEAIMAVRAFTPDPEMRGLRTVDLKDEQRSKIQPASIALAKKMVPSGFRFMGAQMSEDEQKKAEDAFAKEKETYLAKVKSVLSEDQMASWKEKTAEAKQEVEAMLERRRNFQRQ